MNLTTVSSAQMEGVYGDNNVRSASQTQHLKSLFGADIVYLQQLQQVNSNGGVRLLLLTQGCVYANSAECLKWAGFFLETSRSERLFIRFKKNE